MARKNTLSLKIKNSIIFLITTLKWIKIIDKFLLTGGKCRPELHLKQPGFTSSACGPFTKHNGRIQKYRETGNLKHLYRNELDRDCFAHDAAYSDSKDLAQIKFWWIELMKLLEIVNTMDIKEH